MKLVQHAEMQSDKTLYIDIVDETRIREIQDIYNQLTKQEIEVLYLALMKDIEIILNDNIVIYLQLTNPGFCTYTGLGLSEFVETPDELVKRVRENLKQQLIKICNLTIAYFLYIKYNQNMSCKY